MNFKFKYAPQIISAIAMYLLDILGILKRSKERIQLRARLYYSSEYPFFVLNAVVENQGTF